MTKTRFLILFIAFMTLNSVVKADNISNNDIEKRLERLETIYNITNKKHNDILRLNELDMKAIGLINEGSISSRLEQIEKKYNAQLNQCSTQQIQPDKTPVIDKPVRNKFNPLKYDYQPDYGSYFDIIKDQIIKQGNTLTDYHFKKFPVTYSIESNDPKNIDIIQSSLVEYKKIIPIKRVGDSSKADIQIKVINKEQMTSIAGDGNKLGVNKTGTKSQNGKVIEYKSEVLLNQKIFNYPMSIYASSTINHEFLHALGISGHSDSPFDILYPQIDVNILYGAQVALIKKTCQIKDFDQFKKLSQRDLNTLWLLYNLW